MMIIIIRSNVSQVLVVGVFLLLLLLLLLLLHQTTGFNSQLDTDHSDAAPLPV